MFLHLFMFLEFILDITLNLKYMSIRVLVDLERALKLQSLAMAVLHWLDFQGLSIPVSIGFYVFSENY